MNERGEVGEIMASTHVEKSTDELEEQIFEILEKYGMEKDKARDSWTSMKANRELLTQFLIGLEVKIQQKQGIREDLPHTLERLNHECARRRSGMILTMRPDSSGDQPDHVLLHRDWTNEDLAIFKSTGYLSVTLYGSNIDITQAVLPISTLRVLDDPEIETHPGRPAYISGQRLFSVTMPCLWMIDTMPVDHQAYPHSHLLIPSEFIDNQKILSDWSKMCGKVIGSFQEYADHLHSKFSSAEQRDRETALYLPKYLKRGAILQELMVRESDLWEAMTTFSRGHFTGSRRLNWYEDDSSPMYAKGWYLVQSKDLHPAWIVHGVEEDKEGWETEEDDE